MVREIVWHFQGCLYCVFDSRELYIMKVKCLANFIMLVLQIILLVEERIKNKNDIFENTWSTFPFVPKMIFVTKEGKSIGFVQKVYKGFHWYYTLVSNKNIIGKWKSISRSMKTSDRSIILPSELQLHGNNKHLLSSCKSGWANGNFRFHSLLADNGIMAVMSAWCDCHSLPRQPPANERYGIVQNLNTQYFM